NYSGFVGFGVGALLFGNGEPTFGFSLTNFWSISSLTMSLIVSPSAGVSTLILPSKSLARFVAGWGAGGLKGGGAAFAHTTAAPTRPAASTRNSPNPVLLRRFLRTNQIPPPAIAKTTATPATMMFLPDGAEPSARRVPSSASSPARRRTMDRGTINRASLALESSSTIMLTSLL